MITTPSDLPATLRRLRRASNLTQAEMANRLGYACRGAVQRYERGERAIDANLIEGVARVLGYRVEVRFVEDGE